VLSLVVFKKKSAISNKHFSDDTIFVPLVFSLFGRVRDDKN
jgi:hypothetical protein